MHVRDGVAKRATAPLLRVGPLLRGSPTLKGSPLLKGSPTLKGSAVLKGAVALGVAAVVAGAAQLPAGAAVRSAGPGTAAGSAPWRARAVAPLSARTVAEVVSPRANAVYELLDRSVSAVGPYRLRRVGLASKAVVKGPEFPVSQISLAGGYVWVSGAIARGNSSFRLALYQVNPATLRVVRSWRLTGERSAGLQNVPVTSGPAGTVWAGFDRTLWRLNTSTGTIVTRARLGSGLSVTEVAVDPARTHLYVSAEPRLGGGALREYSASSGRLLASQNGRPVKFSIAGAALTAVPGRVWASFRTGMAGQTILLRQRGLGTVRLTGGKGLFDWFMSGSTSYGGGATWLAVNSGGIGCLAPATGRVRSRATLKPLVGGGELLGVSALRHEVYAIGQSDIIAVTPPANCWR